ncbi:tetratricopeptide repeat protein [Cytophagaceae bacterium YF14B1]|uniref:Tetratricopeptide repeat protein n=1 Tax=Xanthocytophaga flava TaxID=3048013 RepID=A0AAE3U3U2_9BACT|nr:tetratricopeptide repeat protein [Xanthocytophaga flavus]MDJ1479084.1 tetratricopeptide repeat protein [Xanthocytophaga flavus]
MRPLFICIFLLLIQGTIIQEGYAISLPENDTLYIDFLNTTAEKYLNSNPDTAFVYAKQALLLSEKKGFVKGIAVANENLGLFFYNQGGFQQAVSYLLNAIASYKKVGDKTGVAESYNHLGMAYYYGLKIDVALQCHQEALKIYEQLSDKKGKAETFGYIGHLYEKQKDYPQALIYQEKAFKIYEVLNDKAGLGKITENLGSIFEDMENYPKAYEYFNKALTFNREVNDQVTIINNLNNIGDTYRKQGNYSDALIYTLQAYQLARKMNQKDRLRSALRDLSKTYAFIGDYKKAHGYLDSSYTLYQRIYDEESVLQMARMQTLYQTEAKEKALVVKDATIQLLEGERRIGQLWITLLVTGTVLLLSFGIIFFRYQRLKTRKDRELLEQTQRVLETERENTQLNEQNLKTELENKRLKELQLQQELETRSRELTTHALQIVQKNKFLEELKVKLNEIRRSEKDKTRQIKELIASIDYSFKLDQDWEDFKRFFEQVHPDFFQNLQSVCTDLSAHDKRLCALLRLNLSSTDISTILGISQDSLRIARYRLRKKLKLEERANLTAFLVSF